MASFVLLIKEVEDDDRVVYKFGPNEETMWKIDKFKEYRS